MHDFVTEMLCCPHCRGTLDWRVKEQHGGRIEEAEARCAACGAIYPVREGIGLFLTPDLPRDDLWEQVESGLTHYVSANPDVERRLMDGPADALAPADQFFRALVLEERGEYDQAKALAESAHRRLYTAEYRFCHERQTRFVIERLSGRAEPVVDQASGRGALVEAMARELTCPVIASDFSPRILRRDRHWLKYFGLYDRVSLLCFDARRTPFKDGAIALMTSNLGLPNVAQPDVLLPELRRVVAGTLLAISHFIPADDEVNLAAAREGGYRTMSVRAEALDALGTAGWHGEAANLCVGRALPTPRGVILKDMGIDGFPVAETSLEWCSLVAH